VSAGRPLRIAIDASAIPRQMAGAGVYTYQLVRALAGQLGEHELFVFARPGLFDDLASQRLRVVHFDPPSRAARLAWEQTLLPLLLRRLRIDVLHSPHHHTPLAAKLALVNRGRAPKLVVTFHDVTFLLLPASYTPVRRLYMEAVTRASARVADAIITPSQAVRYDVIERLHVPSDRVVAIPEAAGPQFARAADGALGRMRWKYHLPTRYVLSVGSLEPGKNRRRLIHAYAQLWREGLDCPLVVAGQPAWRYRGDLELVRRLGLEDRVRFLGYVPDDDLPALYSGATIFAFPSLYEGFGLPVLEAMSCGTPVITSSISATAEVAGDAALVVDPRDTDALAEAIRRVARDAALRGDLRARGLERARHFSWQRTARETLFVYELVAAQR
jgi:glycosyltransferase involved in cell wall biosynthesis